MSKCAIKRCCQTDQHFRQVKFVKYLVLASAGWVLTEVPDDLVIYEINGWKTNVSTGILSLKEIDYKLFQRLYPISYILENK